MSFSNTNRCFRQGFYHTPFVKENTMRIRGLVHIISAVLLISGAFAADWAQFTPPRVRTVLNLNTSWKFMKQNLTGAQATNYSDASWSSINLPHSFDIPYFRASKAVPPYVGWYRRHVTIAQASLTAHKRFSLEFGGSFIVTTVYVNGDSVGQHCGGYTGFAYDITQYLAAGDNVIAVKVDGSWQHVVAPRSGEHIFIGGIYRDVSLVVTEPIHVAWYGTFVTTPTVSTSSAVIKVKTEVVSADSLSDTCTVENIVVDADGNTVATMQSTQKVTANATDTFVQISSPVASPNLWSPSSPYLYAVYTEVYKGSQLVDNYESPLGIRSVKWTTDSGLFLNGKHIWLHGADAHQDHAGWGDATTRTGCARDVKLINKCGMNFIRGSHYPHNPAFADECDSLGICFWSEMCFWSSGASSTDTTMWEMNCIPNTAAEQQTFDSNVITQLREMVKINRNHPSIVIWSMCNEVFFPTGGSQDTLKKGLLEKMVAVCHQQDSTRLAAIGGAQRSGYDLCGDAAGFNGDGATLYISPAMPNMVTEYGSCQEDRPGTYTACWGSSLQTADDSAVEYPWRSGISLWCAFHHGSNANMGNMGILDHARLPLEGWYYYRQKNLGIASPTWPSAGTAAKLAIFADRDTITDDGKSDVQLTVQVQDAAGNWLSNTPNISLTDNSGLGIFPSANAGGTSITFTGNALEEGVRNGLCAIEYRSYNAGTATITASSTGLAGATQTIVINHVADSSIVYLTTGVKGRPVYASTGKLTRQVRFFGNSLIVPPEMHGRICSVDIYSLQGKLVKELELKGGDAVIKLKNIADNSMIARFSTR